MTADGRLTKVSELSGEQYMPCNRMTVCVCGPDGSMTMMPGSSDVARRMRPDGAGIYPSNPISDESPSEVDSLSSSLSEDGGGGLGHLDRPWGFARGARGRSARL